MHQESDEDQEAQVDPLPPHKIRFTDMPWPLVDKAIRRKFLWLNSIEWLIILSYDK